MTACFESQRLMMELEATSGEEGEFELIRQDEEYINLTRHTIGSMDDASELLEEAVEYVMTHQHVQQPPSVLSASQDYEVLRVSKF